MNDPDVILAGEADYYLPETDLEAGQTCFSPVYDYLAAPLKELSLPLQYQLYFPQRLSLASLAGYLSGCGFNVAVVDNLFRDSAELKRFEALLACSPPVVGIATGCMSKASTVARIAAIIRRISPSTKIILGGAGSSIHMEMRRSADLTVIGAGELMLAEIVKTLKEGKNLSQIPGPPITLDPSGNRLIASPELDTQLISAPAWDLLQVRHSHCFSVEASKGCAYKCVFCSYPELGRQRYRPVENVVGEIVRNVDEFGAGYIRFVDPNLTSQPEYVARLCAALKAARLKIPWSCFARIDELADSPAMCRSMAEAGCFWIYSGIESGEKPILDDMDKKYQPPTISQGVRNAKAAGIMMHGNFVAGFPGETRETLKRTTDLIKSSGLDTVSFTVLGITQSMSAHMADRGLKETMNFTEAVAAAKEAVKEIYLSTDDTPLIAAHGIAMYYLLGGGLTLADTMKYFAATRDFHRAREKRDETGRKEQLDIIKRLYAQTAIRFGGPRPDAAPL
jgi:radical SAM superfamily enzyme YgiQ (UPF0313 family)